MSVRQWVSRHLEDILETSDESPMTFLQSGAAVSFDFSKELGMGPERFKYYLEYINGLCENGLTEWPQSAFEAGMPGALTIDEVEDRVDLGQWRLKIRGRIVCLEVSPSLAKFSVLLSID